MSHAYEPGTAELKGRSPSFLQRLLVLILYGIAWIGFSILMGVGLQRAFGLVPFDPIVPESELTPAESLARFVNMYWFTATLFMGVPFGVVSWLALRLHAGGGVVRWKWLLVNIIAMAPMLVLTWLLTRKLLFLP